MKNRFVIFAPSYTPDAGGIIVLHKLCHLINKLDGEAVLYPLFPQYKISRENLSGIYSLVKNFVGSYLRRYKTNPSFNTPVFNGDIRDSDIIIYPEIVFGNPLNAKNVVRWLLNKPGFFTGDVFYGSNELFYKFNHGLVDDFKCYNSIVSENILNILHIPHEIYNEKNTSDVRTGVAYSIRKDESKPQNYHPSDAVLIDGLSHSEIADILKRVKTFISYDSYSAYSLFAVLCGCESIVVPERNVTKDEWYPDISNRYGMAYGTDELDFARSTRNLKLQNLYELEEYNLEIVNNFITESSRFFKLT